MRVFGCLKSHPVGKFTHSACVVSEARIVSASIIFREADAGSTQE